MRRGIVFIVCLIALLLFGSIGGFAEVVEVWMNTAPTEQGKAWQEWVVRTFESTHPGVKVKVEWPRGEPIVLFAGGLIPDLFQAEDRVPTYARLGLLMPIDVFLERYPDLKLEEFFPAVVEYVTYDGKVYGLPYGMAMNGLLYNATAMQEAGLDDSPLAIANWDEFAGYAKRLTRLSPERTIERAGVSFGHKLRSFLGWLYSNGGDFISGRKAVFAGKQGLEAAEFLQGLIFDAQCMDRGGAMNVASGRSAMAVGHNIHFSRILAQEPDLELRFTSLPTGPSGHNRGSASWFNAWAIPKGSKQPILAFELLAILTNLEGACKTFSIWPETIAARIDFYTSADWNDYLAQRPALEVSPDVAQVSKAVPTTRREWEPIWNTIFSPLLEDNTVQPAQVLRDAEQQINQKLVEIFGY